MALKQVYVFIIFIEEDFLNKYLIIFRPDGVVHVVEFSLKIPEKLFHQTIQNIIRTT